VNALETHEEMKLTELLLLQLLEMPAPLKNKLGDRLKLQVCHCNCRTIECNCVFLHRYIKGWERTPLRGDVEKLSVTSHQLCGICAKEVKKLNKKINNTKKNEI
jgi:hypothetical protein